MKRSFKILVLAIVLFATSFSLIGCGSNVQLDQENTISIKNIYQDHTGTIFIKLENDIEDLRNLQVSINDGEWESVTYANQKYYIHYSISGGSYQALDYLRQTVSMNFRLGECSNGNTNYSASEALDEPYSYTVKECLTYSRDLNYIGFINSEAQQLVKGIKTKVTDGLINQFKYTHYNADQTSYQDWCQYIMFMSTDQKVYMGKLEITQEGEEYYYLLRDIEDGKFKIAASGRSYEEEVVGFDDDRDYNWVNVTNSGLALNNFTIIPSSEEGKNYLCFYIMLTETELTTDSIFGNRAEYRILYSVS